ncbi:hypothetical protein DIZ76_014052 [Coccidioides immitis]|nr:hypothetical protein DIZ76_014052 [Coccidioides immitis]
MVDHSESALGRAASNNNNLLAVAESPAPETAPRDASKVADGVPSPPAHDHHHHHHSSSSGGSEARDPDGTSNANGAHDGSPEVDISDFSSDASSTQSLDDYPGLTLGAEYGSSNDLLSFPEQDGQPFGELVEDLSHFYYAPTMDFVSDFADGLSSTASNNSYLDPDDQDMNIHDPFSFATAAPSDPTTPSYVAPPDFGDGLQYDDMALDNDDDHDDHDDHGDNDEYAFADQGFGDEVSDGLHSAHLRFIRDDGSLIERSDLFGFAHDRLPSAMFFGAVNDPNDSCDDRDTDKFYASDDEVSMGDAAMDSEPPGRGRSTDTRIHHNGAIAEDHRVDHETSAHPVPLGTPHLPSLDAVYAQHNDGEVDGDFNNQGGLSMHTESMKASFLNSSVAVSSRTIVQAPSPRNIRLADDHLFNMEGISLHVQKLGFSFANRFSTLVGTRISQILVAAKRHLDKGFIPGVLHTDIFVNQPIISFLSGSRVLYASPHSPARYRKLVLALVSCESSRLDTALNGSAPFILPQAPALPRCHPEEQCPSQCETANSTGASSSSTRPARPLLTEEQYYDLHQPSEYSIYYIQPALILQTFADQEHIASSLLAALLAPPEGDIYIDANGNQYPAFERNLTVDQFIRQWFVRSCIPRYHLRAFKEPFVPISPEAANVLDWERPAKISRPDSSRLYDIQGIPWSTTLKVKRSDARALRDRLYTSYHNLKYTPHGYYRMLPEKEDYFRPKTMYTKYRASMAHFQLRNLMSVTASNTIQYASHSKVYSITPFYGEQNCLINLAGPVPSATFFDSVKISTMRAKHGVTVVGGFSGEYAVRGEINDFAVMDGRVTRDPNGITNHIDIIKHRTSNSPRTVISSNDDRIRILDCETNRFVSMHKFARAINCTDTSPDGRLRVIIGDAPDAWIIDSETGKPVQTLIGHRDYGFACAWSPDMLHIATSNQDKTVNIWDARMWRTLQVIDSDVAGYRSLRFSPVGGGPRTLLMCEPADRIAIVNAQTYQTRQVHDFFGEIGGADYSPDGSRIWVANMDTKFGGFMEFDRREWGQEFGIGHTRRRRIEAQGDFYSPDLPNEWLPEARLDDDPRCVLGSGERKIRFQKLFNDTQC